jgi:type I restriction enzyme S subunit
MIQSVVSVNEAKPLPQGWRWVRLRDVCEKPQYGYTASAESAKVGPKFLRITDIQNGEVHWELVPYCRCGSEAATCILKPGDILFARTGGTTGKSFLVKEVPSEAIFASYLIRVRTKDNLMPKYLYLFLQSNMYWGQVITSKRGGAQPNMNATLLGDVLFPFPPLPEQKRIVARIQDSMKEVEHARNACEAQLEAIKALPPAYMRQVLESEEAKRWERRKLGEVCAINPARPSGFTRLADAATTFVPMAAVNEDLGIISKPEIRPYSEVSVGYTYFEEGDVLYAKITPCMQNGKHAITGNLIDGIGFGSTEFHVIHPTERILSEWIHFFIRQPSFLREATTYFVGAVGQQRVPPSFLTTYCVPLPSLPEQKRITLELRVKTEKAEKLKTDIEKQLEAIKALPRAILRKAFSGEL